MTRHLSKLELEFLNRFARSPDAAFLRRMLEADQKQQDELLRVLDGPDLHRAQGRAQAFTQVLGLLKEGGNSK